MGSMRRQISGRNGCPRKRQKHESLFFAIVLARSRYKFTCFSRRPFDTELAIYAHERAFEYFGGKPEKILYDQDRVLISRENLGDLVLTRKFQTLSGSSISSRCSAIRPTPSQKARSRT